MKNITLNQIRKMTPDERRKLHQNPPNGDVLRHLDDFADEQIQAIWEDLNDLSRAEITTFSACHGDFYATYGELTAEDINSKHTSDYENVVEQMSDEIKRQLVVNPQATMEIMGDEIKDLLADSGVEPADFEAAVGMMVDLIREELVVNFFDVPIDYEVTVNLMNDEIREQLHNELAPCSAQEFFDAYAERHLEKFGEGWVLDDPNPVY